MVTKLTLSVDPEIIQGAKVWARRRNKSVSALVENYLRSLSNSAPLVGQTTPWTERLYGACRPETPFVDETESLVADLVAEKHR